MTERKNNVFIISAPSGAGKSTLIQLLVSQIDGLFFSVSHTTRPPREGERNGVEYFFVDHDSFSKMVDSNLFLEWANVHGYFYGTSREMVTRATAQEKDLLLDVDIQGAAQVHKLLPEAVTIFIMPPSFEILRERLGRRQKDTEIQIGQRLDNARKEIQFYNDYDFIVVNEDLGSAFENLAGIVRGQRCRREMLQERIKKIIGSFEVQ